MQIYGSFAGFPLIIIVHCLGWSYNDPGWYPPTNISTTGKLENHRLIPRKGIGDMDGYGN